MRRLAWLAVALAAPAALAEQAGDLAPIKVAVFDIAATGVDEATARTFSEILAVEVGRVPGAQVISNAEIANLLGLEAQKQVLGCDDDVSCVTEVAGALGVDKLCSGSLGKVENTAVLSLRVIDVRTAKVDQRLYEVETGAAAFITRMPQLVARLFPDRFGDAPAVTEAPAEKPAEVVAPPRPYRSPPAKSMVPASRPWYRNHWIWAGVGALFFVGGMAALGDDRDDNDGAGFTSFTLGTIVGLGSAGVCAWNVVDGSGGDAPEQVLRPLSSPFEMSPAF